MSRTSELHIDSGNKTPLQGAQQVKETVETCNSWSYVVSTIGKVSPFQVYFKLKLSMRTRTRTPYLAQIKVQCRIGMVLLRRVYTHPIIIHYDELGKNIVKSCHTL